MKKSFLSVLLLSLSLPLAAGTPVPMTPQQREAFAIRTSGIEPVSSAISSAYPAKVVVPNAQLRVVSAPQSGLLEALLVSEGESVEAGQPLAQIQSPQLLERQSAYLEARSPLQQWAARRSYTAV